MPDLGEADGILLSCTTARPTYCGLLRSVRSLQTHCDHLSSQRWRKEMGGWGGRQLADAARWGTGRVERNIVACRGIQVIIYHLRLQDSEPPVHTARLVFSECFPCWAESYKACISYVAQGTVAFWDETCQESFTQPRICLVLQ